MSGSSAPFKGRTSIRRLIWRIKRYFQYEFKEIVFPSSLPNPPGYVEPPPLSRREKFDRMKLAFRIYLDTWDQKKLEDLLYRNKLIKERYLDRKSEKGTEDAELKALKMEYRKTMNSGAKALGPYLQYLYRTRIALYQNAVKEFIIGYKQGFKEAYEEDSLGKVVGKHEKAKESVS